MPAHVLVIARGPTWIPVAVIVEIVLLHLVHDLVLRKLLLELLGKLLRCNQILVCSWSCNISIVLRGSPNVLSFWERDFPRSVDL